MRQYERRKRAAKAPLFWALGRRHSRGHCTADASELIVLSGTAGGFLPETLIIQNIFASVPHLFLRRMSQKVFFSFPFFFFAAEASLYNLNSDSKCKE